MNKKEIKALVDELLANPEKLEAYVIEADANNSALESKEKECAELEKALGVANDQKEIDDERITNLETDKAKLEATVEELMSTNGQISAGGGDNVVMCDKIAYTLRTPKFVTKHEGKVITVDIKVLKETPALVSELVAKKSPHLVQKGGDK